MDDLDSKIQEIEKQIDHFFKNYDEVIYKSLFSVLTKELGVIPKEYIETNYVASAYMQRIYAIFYFYSNNKANISNLLLFEVFQEFLKKEYFLMTWYGSNNHYKEGLKEIRHILEKWARALMFDNHNRYRNLSLYEKKERMKNIRWTDSSKFYPLKLQPIVNDIFTKTSGFVHPDKNYFINENLK